jgi:hypothetical protein
MATRAEDNQVAHEFPPEVFIGAMMYMQLDVATAAL